MTVWEWLVAMVLALVAAVVVHPTPYYTRAKAAIAFWWITRKTGLKAIYPRSYARAGEQSRSILRDARDGDEILMVGRTQKGFLEANEQLIMKALESGANLKILFLDQRVLQNRGPGQHVDLRSLRLPNAYSQLVDDVGRTEAKLRELRDRCRAKGVHGSLLVYRTGVLVQSSVVIYVPCKRSTRMRVLFDFSFGGEVADKFVQYYRSTQRDSKDDFCNRLHKFYASLFDPDVSSFAYDRSYRYSAKKDPVVELQKLANERIEKMIQRHNEVEEVRNNTLVHIMPTATSVFKALSSGTFVPPPLSAQIELTNVCSTTCKHCFRYSTSGMPHVDHMGKDLAKRILLEMHEFGVRTITLSGGEPTMHPEFAKLLRYAAVDQNLSVGVLSNGVNVSQSDLTAIHTHARWLRLSIDGSPSVYGQIRTLSSGKDAFSEVQDTIDRFVHLNDNAVRCKLSICYTIQRNNAEDVREMIEWVRRLGIPNGDKCLTFKFAHGRNGFFLCEPKQLKALYSDVINNPEFQEAANVPYLRWFLERQSSIPDVVKGRPTESLYLQQPTRCFTPHLFTLIDPKGDVYPCCFLYEDNQGYTPEAAEKRRVHCIGSLRTKSFGDLWNSTKYQEIRGELASINPKDSKYAACGECTRHCNHNRGLSQLYAEYSGLRAADGDADSVMKEIIGNTSGDDVWL